MFRNIVVYKGKDKYYETMDMRRINRLLLGVWLVATAMLAQSCLNDDDDNKYVNGNFPSAVVTIKPDSDNTSFYMQLDDSTQLQPTNISKSPYGTKEVRALVRYTAEPIYTAPNGEGPDTWMRTVPVTVSWIDSIRTKDMVPNLGEDNAAGYGDDPVEIVNDWVTVVEDGYLTLRLRTRMTPGSKHTFNLVAAPDADNPYKVVLYHDAGGDVSGNAGDGLIAFRLKGTLPDTDGKRVPLTLQWNSYSGTKSVELKYFSTPATSE